MSQINRQEVFSTSELSKEIGLSVPVKFLIDCGVTPLAQTNSAVFWRKSDFPVICHAISMSMIEKGKAYKEKLTDGAAP